MLKLMKYEFRKMRMPLLIMLLILVALQGGFLLGDHFQREDVAFLCLWLIFMLAFVLYCYILISGIVSYSRELKDRTGYLVFMAPVRPISIVLSKLIFTILAAIVAGVVFSGVGYLDISSLFRQLNIDASMLDQFEILLNLTAYEMGTTLNQIVLFLIYMGLDTLIQIILIMCTAYLAITLSATLMQRRKGFLRGLVSFLLFAFLVWGAGKLNGVLFPMESTSLQDYSDLLSAVGWSLLYSLGVSAVYAWVSAVLLKRKVNL